MSDRLNFASFEKPDGNYTVINVMQTVNKLSHSDKN